ncbi:hypothetical protein HMPREF1982_04370 [Clostridiales bacterium oral taxon 876 str. F0540]|nr:hypothetical protein HMPREF1982_04370 [Clostridiales bacterium oral taxon 876 str. F0540]
MQTKGKSGDKVQISGVYRNEYGKTVTLIKDDIFPKCPDKGNSTTWQLM